MEEIIPILGLEGYKNIKKCQLKLLEPANRRTIDFFFCLILF